MMTREDRARELKVLVHEMRRHPSAPRPELRDRAWVLARMLRRKRRDLH